MYTSNVKSNVTKHVKSIHKHSCDKCDFVTSNKMHLKLHKKSCHKKEESNFLKRKLQGSPTPSSKKTKKENYPCDKCIYKTNSKRSLKSHKETSCQEKLD